MVHLLEAKGIEVYWLNVQSPCVDAVSYRRAAQPFVFLNTASTSGERCRLSAAHELGHLVLHPDLSSLDNHEIEDEANRFASAFLLPREQFEAEAPRAPILDLLLQLKNRWEVSVAAMIVRGYQLGRYSRWHYENAFKELSRRGWRTKEPGELALERSRLHELVFAKLDEAGVRPSTFAYQLCLNVDDLLELTPAGRDYRAPRQHHLRIVNGDG
jgi:Zn-dependent peptidase ImmA (M78 family)